MRSSRPRSASNQIAGPDQIGFAYERMLAASGARQRGGIYYTPPAVVDYIVEQTLAPLFDGKSPGDAGSLRILDPACGCGAFLLGSLRWLCRWYARQSGRLPTARQRGAIARRHLAGIDIDPAAVSLARQALGQEAGVSPQSLTKVIRIGDALLTHDDWFDGRFAAVVMNPPYVNIRRLTKLQGDRATAEYRSRFRCAVGAFDLYIPFLERSVAALRPQGWLGVIVPNKLATLDYARQCRELLLSEGTLDCVVDVSRLKLFADASVYPHLWFWTKQQPPANHAIRVERPSSLLSAGRPPRTGHDGPAPFRVLQSRQQAERGLILDGDLLVESRVATVPLNEVCTIHSGATGFEATDLSSRLVEADRGRSATGCFDFITSGNIDPYVLQLGNVRFMGRRFCRPILSSADPILTERKRRLYAGPKIVLAGMSRRLEAALDTRGLALGVQVYALADWKVDPYYLLGLLNSRLLSHLFRLRFAAKKLSGDYYSLSKRQIGQLPVRVIDRDGRERRIHDEIVRLVQQRLKTAVSSDAARVETRIDELVLRLYDVAEFELATMSAAA